MQEPPREVRREPCLEDLPGRLLGVVLDAVELDDLGLVVPDAVAGARVVVAGLPAAPVRDEIAARPVDAHPLRPEVPHRRAQLERSLRVLWPDEVQQL